MKQEPKRRYETGIQLRPASIEEAGLFYSQVDADEDLSSGTVGHIRMDFGHVGKEFWHTWWPHNDDQFNTQEFKADLQSVVDALRTGGPLRDLATMRSFCNQNGGKITDDGRSFGYVVDTEHYRYCLRCIPVSGDYAEVMPGQSIQYDLSGIANNSTTSLTSFFWRDILPTQAVRLDKIITGTYNVPGNYKVVYQTNLSNGTWRTMYDNLSTMQNHTLDASPAALGLASNEYVTAFMVSFGVVPANFRQVEAPRIYCSVLPQLTGGTQFVNQADVGGVYGSQWIMATSRWVTRVYKPSEPLPRTGY